MSHCKVNRGIKTVCSKMCSATQSILPHVKKPLAPPPSPSNLYAQVLPDGHVVSLQVKQSHKRREPSKHYEYEVVVGWSCGSNLCVFRRYSSFFELQVQLSAHRDLLVGLGSSPEVKDAVLPTLPGKAIGRINVKQVAQKRKERLEEFCHNIIKLPSALVRSDIVTKFFTLWPDDLALEPITSASSAEDEQDTEPTEFIAIADYNPANMHQISAKAGSKLQVLERRLSGWWLCVSDTEQGYLPASLLQPLEGVKSSEKVEDFSCKCYVVNADYKADNPDELSLKKEQKVEVIFKSFDGWWRVRIGETTGIVPSLYLTEFEHKQRKETLERNSNKELYVTPSNSFKPPPRRGTFNRKEQIVSVYSVLDEVPEEIMKKNSAKYAYVKKSKKGSEKKLESVEDFDEMIHNMLDISLECNPDVGLNYEMSDDLIKGMQMSNSLFTPANKKLPKPPKPPRRYVNPQEIPSRNSLHRSPSTPSFPDYMHFDRSSGHTTILSRPINGTDRNSIKMNRDKRSETRDDGEIDYINWIPSIDPINVEDVNECAVNPPFQQRTSHPVARQATSFPEQPPTPSKLFEAIEKYNAQDDSCISVKAGDRAMLLDKSEDGIWSFVRVNDCEGWTPSEYWRPLLLKKPGIKPPPNIKPTRPSKSAIPNKPPPPNLPQKSTSPILPKKSISPIPKRSFSPELPLRSISASIPNKSPSPEHRKRSPIPIPSKTPPPDHPRQRSPPPDPPVVPRTARKLTNLDRGPLPIPPLRNVSKSNLPSAIPPSAATPQSPPDPNYPPHAPLFPEHSHNLSADLPEVPHRTKSPKTVMTTPVHSASKSQAKKSDLQQFLWGKMSRKDCEVLLLTRAKQGEFIFRESNNREGELVLSMRYHYRIHHFNIKQDDTWYCIGENFRVQSLSEIIVHFQKTPIASYKESGDKLIDVFLSQPLNKES